MAHVENVEVEDEANLFPCKTQIREQLCVMDRENGADGLHLDDDFVVDKHVQPIGGLQVRPVVDDRDRYLASDRVMLTLQFVRQTFLVHRLEQTRTDVRMNTKRRANDGE